MKIAFFGLPVAALLLKGDGHDIVWAGICRSPAIGTRRLMGRIGSRRVRLLPDCGSDRVYAEVRDARPDLVVSWFWTKRIPSRFFVSRRPSVCIPRFYRATGDRTLTSRRSTQATKRPASLRMCSKGTTTRVRLSRSVR